MASGVRVNRVVLCVGASALLYAASFPPLEIPLAAWGALVPLMCVSARLTVVRAALAGLMWGVLVCGLVGWPFGSMLSRHLGLSPWYGWAAFFVAAPALVGVHVALFSAWLSFAARTQRATPLVVASAWAATEFLRHHFSAGIPWAFSGYSQLPWLPIAQVADLAGPYGIGFLLAGANAQLAGIFEPRLRSQHWALSLGVFLVGLLGVYVYGASRLAEEPGADASSTRIAAVQGGFAPDPRSPVSPGQKLARYLDLAARADAADLILWPEYAVEFLPTRFSSESSRLRDATRGEGADLVVGGPHTEADSSGERFTRFNSVYLVTDGQVVDRYDKRELLPVTESEAFGVRGRLGLPSYASGTRDGVFDAAPGTLGVVVCSEAMSPSLVRSTVDEGAELILNPSNDSWFGAESAVRHQLRIATMRAIESRRWLVRSTPTGYSAIIDPWGRVIEESELDEPEVLVADVTFERRRSPYQRYGDVLPWACLALVVVVSLVRPALRTADTKGSARP